MWRVFCLSEGKMNYTKPALSFEQQAQRLLDRGLIAPDKAILTKRLSSVNYYRLRAYWYTFKRVDPVSGDEHFAPNTTFELIWRRYTFDRQLRLLVMDAVEHVEIAILRTRMVEQFTLLHGPFGYCDIQNFNPKFTANDYDRLIGELDDAVSRSREDFVQRFRSKYSSEPRLPLWIVAEVMTFGQLFTVFRNMHRCEQQQLARIFDLYPPVMESWLHTLNFIRNACAHHARLWNRELPIRPVIPDERNHPEWHNPVKFDNRLIFSVLTLLRYLLRFIDTQNGWQIRLQKLLRDYPEIPVSWMGFPENWQVCPIWID
jgi:abortive infection bacteriophage resistance protein